VPNVITSHFFTDEIFTDDTLVDAFAKQSEEECFLFGIGMGLVVGNECVVTEVFAPGPKHPTNGREDAVFLGGNIVGR
jgi:hypothetical protein